jgi:hypothetical protein
VTHVSKARLTYLAIFAILIATALLALLPAALAPFGMHEGGDI